MGNEHFWRVCSGYAPEGRCATKAVTNARQPCYTKDEGRPFGVAMQVGASDVR